MANDPEPAPSESSSSPVSSPNARDGPSTTRAACEDGVPKLLFQIPATNPDKTGGTVNDDIVRQIFRGDAFIWSMLLEELSFALPS